MDASIAATSLPPSPSRLSKRQLTFAGYQDALSAKYDATTRQATHARSAQMVRDTRDLLIRHGFGPLLVTGAGTGTYPLETASGLWGELLAANQAMSLFGDKKLIELRIPGGKPGKEGGEALQNYCKSLPPDTVGINCLELLATPCRIAVDHSTHILMATTVPFAGKFQKGHEQNSSP